MSEATPTYRTGMGTSNADAITLLGHDLAQELIGQISFGELAFWLVAKRRPDPGQLVMFEAVLVSLADHGFTPTAIAARLTYAERARLAAGRAGRRPARWRLAVPRRDRGRAHFLAAALAELPDRPTDDEGWDAVALDLVTRTKAAGRFVPGLGHPVHKVEDPRTPVLFELARENGTFGDHLALFAAIGRVHPAVLGRQLPLNGAGTCGAVLADLDLPLSVMRGFALLARCAGLLGHLAEEQIDPIGIDVYMAVDRNIDYRPPAM